MDYIKNDYDVFNTRLKFQAMSFDVSAILTKFDKTQQMLYSRTALYYMLLKRYDVLKNPGESGRTRENLGEPGPKII